MTDTKYEVDRRYPFEPTKDDICPVPKGTEGFVWYDNRDESFRHTFDNPDWSNRPQAKITHFMVLKYPAEKHTKWLNVSKDCDGNFIRYANLYNTLDDANRHASAHRIACIKVEFEEGEGL